MQRSWAKAADKKSPKPQAPELTDQESRVVGKILEPVKDPDLKTILQKILDQDRKLKWRRGSEE